MYPDLKDVRYTSHPLDVVDGERDVPDGDYASHNADVAAAIEAVQRHHKTRGAR